jgi:hypothetical protein
MPRLCKDCLHCQPLPQELFLGFFRKYSEETRYIAAVCLKAPRTPDGPSLVDGSPDDRLSDPNFYFCATVRSQIMGCGPDARWFEAKK